jgi:hypothetical protein
MIDVSESKAVCTLHDSFWRRLGRDRQYTWGAGFSPSRFTPSTPRAGLDDWQETKPPAPVGVRNTVLRSSNHYTNWALPTNSDFCIKMSFILEGTTEITSVILWSCGLWHRGVRWVVTDVSEKTAPLSPGWKAAGCTGDRRQRERNNLANNPSAQDRRPWKISYSVNTERHVDEPTTSV